MAEGDAVVYALKGTVGHTFPSYGTVGALEFPGAVALANFGVTDAVPTAVIGARGNRAVCSGVVIRTVAGGIAAYPVPTAGVGAHLVLALLPNPALLAQALARLTIAEAIGVAVLRTALTLAALADETIVAVTLAVDTHALVAAVLGAEKELACVAMGNIYFTDACAIDTCATTSAVIGTRPLVARGAAPALTAHALAGAVPAAHAVATGHRAYFF